MDRRIGFVGTGRIAEALVESLCTSGRFGGSIILSPRNLDRSSRLAQKFDFVRAAKTNQDVIDNTDIIFLALNPGVFETELPLLRFSENHIVISLIPFLLMENAIDLIKTVTSISRAIPLPSVKTHNCPVPVLNPVPEVMELLSFVGQPFAVGTEHELHVFWTMTCLISPFYDLMGELSDWCCGNGIEENQAARYIADLFKSLSMEAGITNFPNFNELASGAATPGGMNEWTAEFIRKSGTHRAYREAAEEIFRRFPENQSSAHS